MTKKLLLTLLGVVTLAMYSFAAQQSFKITDQTGQFTARFSVVPNANGINAAVGLGPSVLSSWGDFNCIVAFGTADTITVRNGSTYMNDYPVRYESGKRYLIQMDVDVVAKTYTVKVTAPGKRQVVIAQDYAFREDNFTGTISYFSTRIESTVSEEYLGVSGFQIGDNTVYSKDQDWFNVALEPQTGDFFTKVVVTPSDDNMSGIVGLSGAQASGFSGNNTLVSFGSDGKIIALDAGGVGYKAVNTVSYIGGQHYMLLISGNTDTKKYNVLCASPDGSVDTIAWNYNFRVDQPLTDTMRYITAGTIFNTSWSGKDSTTLLIDGIETGTLKWEDVNPATITKMDKQTGTFSKTFAVTPSANKGNVALCLAGKESAAWSDQHAIVSFGDGGTIVARNDGAYEADVDFNYKAGQTYTVTFDCDIANDTYDVTVKGPSPHDAAVKIADDYVFRSAPVDSLAYVVTKAMWNPSYGIPGSYITVAEVGITENVYNPDANHAPTIDLVSDITLGDAVETIDLTGITDGDDGSQTVTVTAKSENVSIVSVDVENVSGNNWKLHLTPVGTGSTVITVTLKDDGGTELNGEDTRKISFNANVGKLGLEVNVYKAKTKPTIDGFIDDNNDGWIEWHSCQTATGATVTDNFSAEYSIMWDDNYFYVAGKANDDTPSETGGADHEYDHVEFYFHMSATDAPNGAYKEGTWQLRGSRDDLSAYFTHDQFWGGRWGGNNIIAPWRAWPMCDATGWESGFVEDGSKWSFEAQVPRTKLLEGVTDFDGEHFRWDIYFVDNQGAISDMTYLYWNTELGPKHQDMRSFGYATMKEDVPSAINNLKKNDGSAFVYNGILNIRNVEGQIQLYNITGGLVLSEKVHGKAAINISYLKSGIYLVKGDNLNTTKVIK